MNTVPTPVTSPLDDVEHYAERFRRYDDRRDRNSGFLGIVEALADDTTNAPAVTVARLRAVVQALRQVEAGA